MVKLKKTGRFLDGKGREMALIEKDGRAQIVPREKIGETWINSGGSFDSHPLTTLGYKEPFRLPSADRKSLLDEGYRLWKYDALGGTIVSLTTYFVLGRGVRFTFDDDKAQFFLEKFYKKNKLEMRLRSASDESVAFGEIFMWLRPHNADVRSRTGKVVWRAGDTQVTFIEPANITNIETSEEDPTDVRNYIYEFIGAERSSNVITIPDISQFDMTHGDIENGCMVHIKLNAGNMDPFGHSDLVRVKEWLDNYQEYLRDGVIIQKLYRSPCFDVSIEDGTPEEISAAIARYRAWTIGSNPIHNSREKWQILEFTGPNTSSETARRSLLLIIAAGVGFAEYMLADGSNSNMASSKSQELPVIKKFQDRQDIFTHFLMQVFQFALLAKATLARGTGLEIEKDSEGDPMAWEGQVRFPTIAEADDIEVAQTNTAAMEAKYMSPRTAAARLNLNYAREVEIMLQDKELTDALKDAGIITDPVEDAVKIAQATKPEPVAGEGGNKPAGPAKTSTVSAN